MSEAPEKIWFHPEMNRFFGERYAYGDVEYTRSDIANARISELEAENKRLEQLLDSQSRHLESQLNQNGSLKTRIAELEAALEAILSMKEQLKACCLPSIIYEAEQALKEKK